jgi:nitroreductase
MREDPVSTEQIELLLRNAMWAPTHGMTEPWRFVVFAGAARSELAEALRTMYAVTTPAAEFREEKQQKLVDTALRAPVTIAIGMVPDPRGKIPEIEEIAAVACAVQNMHLTATAMGLAAKWSSPAVCYTPELAAFLGLPESGRCLGFFYVGHPAGPWPTMRRSPVETRVTWR